MDHGKQEVILESNGVLGQVFPKIFRETLPVILDAYRGERIVLVVTTRVEQIRQEAMRQGCFFQSSRDGEPPQFTWKASGVFNTVIRQFRLDFLRHLGRDELGCHIGIAIYHDLMTPTPMPALPPLPPLESLRSAAPLRSLPKHTFHSFGNGKTVHPTAEQHSEKATKPDAATAPSEGNGHRASLARPKHMAEVIETGPNLFRAPMHHKTIEHPAGQTSPEPVKRGHALPGNLYEEFFGFERMPFNNTPDSSFFFPSAKHKEALSRLVYAISERKGFVMISGEIGAGKSTLCRTLLAQLPNEVKTAYITHTYLDGNQLVRAIAEDMGINTNDLSHYDVLKALNQYLIEQLALGCTVCIIIDEAQNLSPQALEEVRMISNLETEQEKLVQLILLGQPDLREKIHLPELKQLRQRIAVQFHLGPLDQAETIGYITHRLKIAKPSQPLKFPRRSMIEVFRYSEGVPRLVNILCDNALLTAFTQGKRVITPALIAEAGRDLDLQPGNTGFSQFFKFW